MLTKQQIEKAEEAVSWQKLIRQNSKLTVICQKKLLKKQQVDKKVSGKTAKLKKHQIDQPVR